MKHDQFQVVFYSSIPHHAILMLIDTLCLKKKHEKKYKPASKNIRHF